ncbi:hypothetical protein [Pseudomonas japonica]|uniref:Uncharacterized protein n=1 Tax=Pseudomonas japonica TaxID=256466 RepID=A0A239EVC4_9PSED|nr:hypothetical protein [Pseudomonas japonica]SNS48537.1 hypothetical protein SAMN05444352_108191 [Pseudomonas japonica]
MKVKVWVVFSLVLAMFVMSLGSLIWLVLGGAPSLTLDSTAAAWVQAIGSVVALIFAVWLPAQARNADRRQAREARKSLLAVLLADVEHSLRHGGLHDPAAVDRALRVSLERLDDFLGRESSIQLANEVLDIRVELRHLHALVGSVHMAELWNSHSASVLQKIQHAKVRIAGRSVQRLSSSNNAAALSQTLPPPHSFAR